MPNILGNKIFTFTLTNDTLTIGEGNGVVAVSIQCTTSTAGSVTGDAVVAGESSAAISITEGNSVTIASTNGKPISSLTITAPSGCTLIIVANS